MVYSGRRHNSDAGRVLRHEHAPPNVLARKVDEHVGRLEHGRLDPRIALALEQRDQRIMASVSVTGVAQPFVPACSLAMRAGNATVFRPGG